MPELPEVETTMRGLAPHVEGRTIAEVICRRDTLRIPIPDDMADILEGAQIKQLKRRSKYLLFYTDKQQVLLNHFGMTGTWTVREHEPEEWRKHDHILIRLDNDYWLVYHDPRRFGLATLCAENEIEQHKLIKDLGPEPLTDNFDGDVLYSNIHKRNTPIKLAIMNAKIVVGVGNIYASESLFRSRILPTTPCNKLTKKQCNHLAEAIKNILHEAIIAGGSSFKDYVSSDGNIGYFQHNFQVYERKGKPCTVCDTPIQHMVQSNRSTYFCSNCQK